MPVCLIVEASPKNRIQITTCYSSFRERTASSSEQYVKFFPISHVGPNHQ